VRAKWRGAAFRRRPDRLPLDTADRAPAARLHGARRGRPPRNLPGVAGEQTPCAVPFRGRHPQRRLCLGRDRMPGKLCRGRAGPVGRRRLRCAASGRCRPRSTAAAVRLPFDGQRRRLSRQLAVGLAVADTAGRTRWNGQGGSRDRRARGAAECGRSDRAGEQPAPRYTLSGAEIQRLVPRFMERHRHGRPQPAAELAGGAAPSGVVGAIHQVHAMGSVHRSPQRLDQFRLCQDAMAGHGGYVIVCAGVYGGQSPDPAHRQLFSSTVFLLRFRCVSAGRNLPGDGVAELRRLHPGLCFCRLGYRLAQFLDTRRTVCWAALPAIHRRRGNGRRALFCSLDRRLSG
jgi:hypothetical protein